MEGEMESLAINYNQRDLGKKSWEKETEVLADHCCLDIEERVPKPFILMWLAEFHFRNQQKRLCLKKYFKYLLIP